MLVERHKPSAYMQMSRLALHRHILGDTIWDDVPANYHDFHSRVFTTYFPGTELVMGLNETEMSWAHRGNIHIGAWSHARPVRDLDSLRRNPEMSDEVVSRWLYFESRTGRLTGPLAEQLHGMMVDGPNEAACMRYIEATLKSPPESEEPFGRLARVVSINLASEAFDGLEDRLHMSCNLDHEFCHGTFRFQPLEVQEELTAIILGTYDPDAQRQAVERIQETWHKPFQTARAAASEVLSFAVDYQRREPDSPEAAKITVIPGVTDSDRRIIHPRLLELGFGVFNIHP